MAIKVKQEAAIPPGQHEGVIIDAVEMTKTYRPEEGPQEIVQVTIQPRWKQDKETDTIPVTVDYPPVLNGLSGFSKLLNRLGLHPKKGEDWHPATLNGTEVRFVATHKEGEFVRVDKHTVSKL